MHQIQWKISDDLLCTDSHGNTSEYIYLGDLPANEDGHLILDIEVSEESVLQCDICGMSVRTRKLIPGRQNAVIDIEGIRNQTVLYGDIKLISSKMQYICIYGKAVSFTQQRSEYQASLMQTGKVISLSASDFPLPPYELSHKMQNLCSGQRLSLQEYNEVGIRMVLQGDFRRLEIDIDAYVFLLNKDDRVDCDEDLIFWGNPDSCKSYIMVRKYDEAFPDVFVLPSGSDLSAKHCVIYFAIYNDTNSDKYMETESPVLRIFGGLKEIARFPLPKLRRGGIVNAAEIYRYNGQLRMKCSGFLEHRNLQKVCLDYGVEVEGVQ